MGRRPILRGVAVLLFIVGVIPVAVIALTSGGSGGSPDRYGRVSIPGETTIDLKQGMYIVYYQEHGTRIGRSERLHVPSGITFEARAADGGPQPDAAYGHGPGQPTQIFVRGSTPSRQIGRLAIKADGRYTVTATGSPGRAGHDPALTIGTPVGG